MELEMTKDMILFKKFLQNFVEKEVKPIAHDIDEEERFPFENAKLMGKLGLYSLIFPKKYGGADGNTEMYTMAITEISKYCATTAVVLGAHVSLCMGPIYEFGTEEQKQRYLPKLMTGENLGAFGLTEPNAGTDSSAQQTTAVLDGDYYVLNGSKIFITNAGYADIYVVFAMTDKSQGTKGISAFIVEKGFSGFTIGKKEKKLGIRGSSTCELIFNNCRVPKENLLGKEGKGFAIAMKTLDNGRIGIGAQALGIAMGALEETIRYTKERKQFNRPIAAFQNTQFQIADMYTKIEAASLLVKQAARAKDMNSSQLGLCAAMAKLYASEVAMEVTTKAVQLHGGYGYTREYPVERMMRDAKITEIYEGTSEVQRMVIAGNVIK